MSSTNIDLEILGFFLDEADDLLKGWEKACMSLEKGDAESVNELFRMAHNLKGSSRSVGLGDLGNFVHRVEDLINALKHKTLGLSPTIITTLLSSQSLLSQWITGFRTNPQFTLDTTLIINDINSILKDPSAHQMPPTDPQNSESKNAENVGKPQIQTQEKENFSNKSLAKQNESLRISSGKLDKLLQLVGELSINQSIIWHGHKEHTLESTAAISAINMCYKITKEIQEATLALRMQPLDSMFQRLQRSIRDISGQLKKEVITELIGSEVELDKTVIENITDPLVHIVRNAVDHGIETDSMLRLAHGKKRSCNC